MSAPVLTTSQGQYARLEAALPDHDLIPAGVILFDPSQDRLGFRLRRDWDHIAEPEDAEVFTLLSDDLEMKMAEMRAEALLGYLEETLSNVLRVSDRETVLFANFETTLNRLYNQLVPSTVLRFETHLPIFSCQAAAGQFGNHMQVEEEGWAEAPPESAPDAGHVYCPSGRTLHGT